MPESTDDWEDHKWTPTAVQDGDLVMYLRAARSMAAFVGMCDGGSTEDGCAAASMDETTINSLDMLHHFNYDTGKALQALVKTINPKSIEKRWSEEEAKKFAKGIRLYGKNFFRIRKELLPNRETGQLVEYYYFWKKTSAASNTRPHRRHRRSNVRRAARNQRPPSSEYLTSTSELSENESEESDRELTGYSCCHCYTTTSKDWHRADKGNALLCTECRLFFKKYGEGRANGDNAEPPPFMFKPVQEDKEGLRDCINQTEEQDTKETSVTPDSTDSALGSRDDDCKSPSLASESSLCTSDNKSKDCKRSPVASVGETQEEVKCKRLKESRDHSESPESFTDGSSAYGNDDDDDDDENDDDNDDGDNNNQDDLSSAASSNPPSPQAEADSGNLKQGNNYLKQATTGATAVQSEAKAAGSEEDDDDEDDSDNSDSDSGSDSEESGSGQQEESTEESTRPSSEAQSSTEEPAASQELLFNIKHEPVDPELGPADSQGHSHSDTAEQLDVKPVLGIPPDYYRSNTATANTGQTETPTGDRASPLTSEAGGPSISPASSMSVTVSSSSGVASTRPGSPGQEKTAALQSAGLAGLPAHMLSSHLGLLPPHQGLLPHHFLGHQGPLHAPPPLVPASSSALSPLQGSLSVSGHSVGSSLERLNSTDSVGLPHSEHHRTHSPRPMSPNQGHLSSDVPMSRSPQLHLLSRSSPSYMKSGTPPPHRLSQTPPPPHGVPLSRSSPLSHRLSRSPPLHRSHSPGALQPTNSSRPPSRSRSRSPLSRESDSEPEMPRSPSPEPRIMNEECYRTKNAIFIKHWFRGRNTCSRCDFEFQPYADSKLAQKREERHRKMSGSSSMQPVRTVKEEQKEDLTRDRDLDREQDRDHMDEKSLKKAGTPPENKSADAQITSTLMNSQQVPPYALERHTPRAGYPPGHDPTPALRTLSEYARPHALGAQDQARSLPYTLANLPPHAVDPYYRMASMYPPGSRERLELELERDKRERDERERQLRERELREMELREKMKHEMDLKPPGFDRFPPGHLDPQYIELQRHMSRLPPGAPPPGSSHIPGVYPPASLASDLLQRERERIDRLGGSIPPLLTAHLASAEAAEVERQSAERLRLHTEYLALSADPLLRLPMGGLGPIPGGTLPPPPGLPSSGSTGPAPTAGSSSHTHTHAHSHTHLHLHQPDIGVLPFHPLALPPVLPPGLPEPVHPTLAGPAPSAIAVAAASAQNNAAAVYDIYHRSYTPEQIWLMQRQMGLSVGMPVAGGGSLAKPITEQDLARMESGSALLAHYFSRADPLGTGAAIGPQLPPTIPPGHPLLAPAREQELLYRELLNRPPCNTDPVLAHQLTVQHEAIQRHLAMERERLTGGAPPGPHLPH